MCKHLMVDSLLLTLRKPRFSFAQAYITVKKKHKERCYHKTKLSQNEAIQNQSNATLLQAQLSTDLS